MDCEHQTVQNNYVLLDSYTLFLCLPLKLEREWQDFGCNVCTNPSVYPQTTLDGCNVWLDGWILDGSTFLV